MESTLTIFLNTPGILVYANEFLSRWAVCKNSNHNTGMIIGAEVFGNAAGCLITREQAETSRLMIGGDDDQGSGRLDQQGEAHLRRLDQNRSIQ